MLLDTLYRPVLEGVTRYCEKNHSELSLYPRLDSNALDTLKRDAPQTQAKELRARSHCCPKRKRSLGAPSPEWQSRSLLAASRAELQQRSHTVLVCHSRCCGSGKAWDWFAARVEQLDYRSTWSDDGVNPYSECYSVPQ